MLDEEQQRIAYSLVSHGVRYLPCDIIMSRPLHNLLIAHQREAQLARNSFLLTLHSVQEAWMDQAAPAVLNQHYEQLELQSGFYQRRIQDANRVMFTVHTQLIQVSLLDRLLDIYDQPLVPRVIRRIFPDPPVPTLSSSIIDYYLGHD